MRGQPTLPRHTVAQIRGMARRGDRQTDIAQWFRLSPSTVNRIKLRRVPAYSDVAPADPADLPPPGPYIVVAQAVHDEALSARRAKELLVAELQQIIARHTQGNTPDDTLTVDVVEPGR